MFRSLPPAKWIRRRKRCCGSAIPQEIKSSSVAWINSFNSTPWDSSFCWYSVSPVACRSMERSPKSCTAEISGLCSKRTELSKKTATNKHPNINATEDLKMTHRISSRWSRKCILLGSFFWADFFPKAPINPFSRKRSPKVWGFSADLENVIDKR